MVGQRGTMTGREELSQKTRILHLGVCHLNLMGFGFFLISAAM